MEGGGECQAPAVLQPLAEAPQLPRSASAAALAAALAGPQAPRAPAPTSAGGAAEQMRACSAAVCLQQVRPVQVAAAAVAGVVAGDAHAAVGA